MPLTDEQRRSLEEVRFAVLGTVSASGAPHPERDPRASVLVCDDTGYRYLRIEGRVRRVDDPAAGLADIRRLALRYYGGDEARVERAVRERWSREHRVSYRLPLTRVYEYR